jgi:hypothetical protein
METRKQMLQSTYRRHKFEVDSKEILNRLEEKEKSLQDSKDPNQLIFEIETLKDKVDAINKEANDLEQGYGGDKKQEINDIKDAVDAAYNDILAKSKEKLKENEFNNDKERFNTIARELTQWCNAIMKRLYAIETPRDVNACEKSIATIHAIENERKARDKDWTEAKTLKEKLQDPEVDQKMEDLIQLQSKMIDVNQKQLTNLQIANDMLLFLRDADVVDEWLRTQQNLLSDDLQSPTTFDIDRTQRDIIDIERRQGHAKTFEERITGLKKTTTYENDIRQKEKQQAEQIQKDESESEKKSESSVSEEKPKPNVEIQKPPREVSQQPPTASNTSSDSSKQNDNLLANGTENGDRDSDAENKSPNPLPSDGSKRKTNSESSSDVKSASGVTPRPPGPEPKAHRGYVNRKFLVLNNKQAKDRSWSKCYGVVENGLASFYKDRKHENTNKEEFKFALNDVKLSREQHHKKSFVLKLAFGETEVLLEVENQNTMEQWLSAFGSDMETISMVSCASPSPSTKSGTKGKRRSLFSKIKK